MLRPAIGFFLATNLSLLAAGCVHRQLVIDSYPRGAIVQVNGQTIGPTPVDFPFTYYGTYRIRLLKDGYQTAVIDQPVPAPFYEWPPLDFISENLWPFPIRDVRQFQYPLQPLQVIPPETVLQRSEEFRSKGRSVGVPAEVPAVTNPSLGPPLAPGTTPASPPPEPGQ